MGIQAWDIWIILYLQDSWDWLEPVMKLFTLLGRPEAYMLLAAMIYWSCNRKLGLRLAIFLTMAGTINSILKLAFHDPRPYWVSSEIKAIKPSNGFGMPSGHAQAATVWLLAGMYLRCKWFWIIAILFTVLIGLSRPFLGVHFPSQILAGWAIGIALMICFLRFEKAVVSWFQNLNFYRQLLVVSGISILIILAGIIILLLTRDWQIPSDWILNPSPDIKLEKAMLRSYSMASIAGNSGAFLGVSMGAILMDRAGGFQNGGVCWIRVLRILLGLACMGLTYLGLNEIKPCETVFFAFAAWRFFGFYLISILVVYLLPTLFIRLKLMKSG
jgi:membrane-associated phospholipid phosphatase